jgi:hypothetical protein
MDTFVEFAGPAAWLGSQLATERTWIHELSSTDLTELDMAMRTAMARKMPLESIGQEHFPLPTLGTTLAQHLRELQDGRGFFVLRGLPIQRYSDDEAAVLFWGIGRYLGTPVKQNINGDQLGRVRDLGKKWGELGVRGYETNGELIFHTDLSDLVGLLCLRAAKSGGRSRIAASATVHNEILRTHPEYLPLLYRGFPYIKREAVESERPVTGFVPVFGVQDGVLSSRVIRERIDSAYRRLGQPMTELERGALDCFAAIAGSEQVCLTMELRPGDMQFVNNYAILHSRTSYEDGESPDQKRHLLRLWLTAHGARRPLPPGFPQANGYGTPGSTPPVGAHELGLAG